MTQAGLGGVFFLLIQTLPTFWAEHVLVLDISISYFLGFQPVNSPGNLVCLGAPRFLQDIYWLDVYDINPTLPHADSAGLDSSQGCPLALLRLMSEHRALSLKTTASENHGPANIFWQTHFSILRPYLFQTVGEEPNALLDQTKISWTYGLDQ